MCFSFLLFLRKIKTKRVASIENRKYREEFTRKKCKTAKNVRQGKSIAVVYTLCPY